MERRKIWVSYLLLILGGLFGIHKFYLNRPILGLVYLLTGGVFFLGLLWDLFTLPSQVQRCNRALGFDPSHGVHVPGQADLQRRLDLLEATERIEKLHRRLDNLETLSPLHRSRSH